MRTEQVRGAAVAPGSFKTAAPGEPTRYGLGTWLNKDVSDGGAYGTRPWIDYDRELIGIFFTQNPLRNVMRLAETEIPNAARAAIDTAK